MSTGGDDFFTVVTVPKQEAFVRRRPSGHKVYLQHEVRYRGEVVCACDRVARADSLARQLNRAMRKRYAI